MRGVFANLVLIAAFQLILAIMLSELSADKVLCEKYWQMLKSDHEWREVINAEEELWNVAEIVGRNNLTEEDNLDLWIRSTPSKKYVAAKRCELEEINSTQLGSMVGINKQGNVTTMGELEKYTCGNYTAGTTGVLITSGSAKRWIWATENRSWH